jgi:tetratricopeptide (TPR) repeat protein
MLEIYRTVYNNHHYLIGIALSNLAGVSVQKQDYARAEQLYREALQAYAGTLPAHHLNVGITNVKLGHALVNEKKYVEAEGHLLSGYEILTKQANPQVSYLRNARTDLVTAYAALNQPEKAERFRKELEIAK